MVYRTVGHVPCTKDLAAHLSFFLAWDFNKGLCEVAGVRVNSGGGYGLEILCVFKLYGPNVHSIFKKGLPGVL